MKLSAWLRLLRSQHFRVARNKWPAAVVTTAMTAGNSALGLLQSALFGERIRHAAIQPDPVFILGHYRTGTTHLHNLLALDERLAFPTTFECFAPHHCVLTDRLYPRLFAWLLPSRRVMDDMAMGLDRPQEDEMALVVSGVPSPYWSVGFQEEHVGRRYLRLTAVSAEERERWEKAFLEFLRLVSFRQPAKPLVLKSPPHTARLAVLARLFPRARYLHLVREPLAVFASTVRLWGVNRAINALAPWTEAQLEYEVLEGLPRMYQSFERDRAMIPPGQFHQLRYEDLVRDPLGSLEACYRNIGLGDFEFVRPRVAQYLAGLRDYRTNDYAVSPQGTAAIRAAWGALFRNWGYEIPGPGGGPGSLT
ncbi:MAG TPA: sulfotransferase [Steroidobacteraceae bacterium]|nr:sulfotransferase [Steroidobacteraceae bacterium]